MNTTKTLFAALFLSMGLSAQAVQITLSETSVVAWSDQAGTSGTGIEVASNICDGDKSQAAYSGDTEKSCLWPVKVTDNEGWAIIDLGGFYQVDSVALWLNKISEEDADNQITNFQLRKAVNYCATTKYIETGRLEGLRPSDSILVNVTGFTKCKNFDTTLVFASNKPVLRYLTLYFPKGCSNRWARCREIEVYGTAATQPTPNSETAPITLNGEAGHMKVYAYSHSGYNLGKANDESVYTLCLQQSTHNKKWCGKDEDGTFNPWVIFELDTIYNISSMKAANGRADNIEDVKNVNKWRVDFSITDTTEAAFTNVYSNDNHNGDNVDMNPGMRKAKYVRLSLMGMEEGTTWWLRGFELKGKKLPAIQGTPFSVMPATDGTGKHIASIHSLSGKTNDNECGEKLLIGADRINGTNDKWCYNSADEGWVIISLTDLYDINKIVWRDGRYLESDCQNVSAYSIYTSTTGTADADFTQVVSHTDLATEDDNLNIKIDEFASPVQARYVKFVATRGSGAIRVYGLDLYGNKSTTGINRGELVSVGKTIMARNDCWSIRELPCRILDGDTTNGVWAVSRNSGDAYVNIDLEDEYDLTGFRLYDSADFIKGFSVIKGTDNGSEITWTDTIAIADYTTDENALQKTATPATTVQNVRYLKLFIPLDMQIGWNRIREFEVYGQKSNSPSTYQPTTEVEELRISPSLLNANEAFRLNESGNLQIYALNGMLMRSMQVEAQQPVTANLPAGHYILRLVNTNTCQQVRLIIK